MFIHCLPYQSFFVHVAYKINLRVYCDYTSGRNGLINAGGEISLIDLILIVSYSTDSHQTKRVFYTAALSGRVETFLPSKCNGLDSKFPNTFFLCLMIYHLE